MPLSVPKYDDFTLPILKILSDGSQHSPKELAILAADCLGISEDRRAELLPSGRVLLFQNRSAWAVTYLFKARLLDRVRAGRYQISERGRAALDKNPSKIDLAYLKQFPEFVHFYMGGEDDSAISRGEFQPPVPTEHLTPQDQLDQALTALHRDLAQELLDRIMQNPPAFFEGLVIDLLVKMGYGGSRRDAGQVVGGPGDGGIDGVIKADRLGLDSIYVQAKRWESKVNESEIRNFVGSLVVRGANRGVFITTSTFQPSAVDYVERLHQKVALIDGKQLAELCIEFGVGVVESARYSVKKIDPEFFDE